MSSLLTKDIQVYDNKRKYAFTNWSKKDFTFKWGGEPYTVRAGMVAEYPQYLAMHATTHFVDRQMMEEGKTTSISSEEARKEYEDKTIVEITEGQPSPAYEALKARIRAEIDQEGGTSKSNPSAAVTATGTTNPVEFAGLKA